MHNIRNICNNNAKETVIFSDLSTRPTYDSTTIYLQWFTWTGRKSSLQQKKKKHCVSAELRLCNDLEGDMVVPIVTVINPLDQTKIHILYNNQVPKIDKR